jgi:hypothetical protein
MLMKLSLLKVLHVSFQEWDFASLCIHKTYAGALCFCTMTNKPTAFKSKRRLLLASIHAW